MGRWGAWTLTFYTQLDERAAWFYEACSTSKGMVTTTPGIGSVYLGCSKDKVGDWLDGANTYRLHVPPHAPVKDFWALTIYDVDTRTLIANGPQMAERNSRQPDLVKNGDGSVDLYVGPKAPARRGSATSASMPRRKRTSTGNGFCQISKM